MVAAVQPPAPAALVADARGGPAQQPGRDRRGAARDARSPAGGDAGAVSDDALGHHRRPRRGRDREGPPRGAAPGGLLDVLWLSGLRSIEAVRLQWREVDLDARTWRIRSPANKGGDQVLPLHPELVPVLRPRMLETASEEGPFALEWHVRNAWRRFKGRHNEWTGWSLHSLRHGFVTRVRAATGDAAASHLARHKSKAMTEHYSHFDAGTFRSSLERLR